MTSDIEYFILADDGWNQVTDPMELIEGYHIIDVDLRPKPVILTDPSEGDVTHNSVTLSWSESDDDDFNRYAIYQSETSETLGDIAAEVESCKVTMTTISGLSEHTEYYFTVRTVDVASQFCDSNQIQVMTSKEKTFNITIIGLGILLVIALLAFIQQRK